jgi:transposase
MDVISHHSVEELQRLRRGAQGGLRDRIQMVVLAIQGTTAQDIAVALSSSRRTVQAWVYRYNAQGLDGLADRRGGNHRHLTPTQEKKLCAYIDREAKDPHGGIRRGEDLRQWIEQQFGILYTLTGVYELLHRLGYSCLMPRPRHAQTDPKAQEAFKKKPARKWSRSPERTRVSGSKSGSRTKRGSANRARSVASGHRPGHGRPR